ncbi:3-isopropylmalate dehydrogenase [Azotosporobacter soli]|uniref:3-isopropylmalate dehydrogenase n=1 Tax=Azotosporobacter soli TaxID=3055040 RepID=UPI0031FF43D6
MKQHTIVVIPGDGIGREITAAAVRVLDAVAAKLGLQLNYQWRDAGGAAIDAVGEPLPTETVAAAMAADAVLLGAVGGPKWDNVEANLRPEQAILGLRKALKLYANLRPIRVPAALADASPLKRQAIDGLDLLIVRELVGGIYFGPKQEATLVDGVLQASDLEIYQEPEVARIVKLACEAAQLRRQSVTSVDKANVLASSRLWRKTAEKVSAAYPDVALSHLYVDNCAMQLILKPRQFDVIVTSNLFGDILSDEAAVLTGSIGMLPSASIGEGTSLYEPIHGSAPDIAGQGIANPLGTILSAALLLRYSLDCAAGAELIEAAVDKTLAQGYRTADLCQPGTTKVSTEEMTSRVLENLA